MWKYTLDVEGMMCSMCEAHVNEAIRKSFVVKKVTSSHKKNQTEIMSEEPLDESKLETTIQNLGYELKNLKKEENTKKGLFRLF